MRTVPQADSSVAAAKAKTAANFMTDPKVVGHARQARQLSR